MMNNIKKYVDETFNKFPNSKKVKALKSEILTNMEKRYKELLKQNCQISQVEKQLIDEIGTFEEIRDKNNLYSKKQVIVFYIEVFIFTLSAGYSLYAKINDRVFISNYNILPREIAIMISNPIAIFLATILTFSIINYTIRPQNIFIQNKRVRMSLLIISHFLMLVYISMILNIAGIIFSTTKLSYFIYKKINVIAVAMGILYYLGSRK